MHIEKHSGVSCNHVETHRTCVVRCAQCARCAVQGVPCAVCNVLCSIHRAPRGHTGRDPQRSPKGPQRAPRGCKGAQQGPKEAHKAPECHRGPKGPRRPQGSHRGPEGPRDLRRAQWAPQGPKGLHMAPEAQPPRYSRVPKVLRMPHEPLHLSYLPVTSSESNYAGFRSTRFTINWLYPGGLPTPRTPCKGPIGPMGSPLRSPG